VAWDGSNARTSGNFTDKIKCVNTKRQSCTGTWEISRSSAILLSAKCDDTNALSQDIIADNFMQLNTFTDLMAESITQPTGHGLRNTHNVDLIVPTVAAALWSRITSLNGPADAPGTSLGSRFPSTQYDIKPFNTSLRYPTLHRHWGLLLIVLLYPVLTIVLIAVRALCYFSIPIDQGFGIVALLAGVETRTLHGLRGASLSGQTKRPVRMKISVEPGVANASGSGMGRIRYLVGELGKADRMRGGEKYE